MIEENSSGAPESGAPETSATASVPVQETKKKTPASRKTKGETPPAEHPAEIAVIEETGDDSTSPSDEAWGEVETVSADGGNGAKKRKRRRRKPKKAGEEITAEADEEQPENAENQAGQESTRAAHPQPQAKHATPKPQPTRPVIDRDAVAKLARKIFLAEVSEEGVALIDDHSAKDLSRRCFRLSEIFLEEQARRH